MPPTEPCEPHRRECPIHPTQFATWKNTVETNIQELTDLQKELVVALQGNWVSPGLVTTTRTLSDRIDLIEKAAAHSKSFLAGVLFAGSTFGAFAGWVVSAWIR